MPIPLPQLDNKTYSELVDEARAAIPGIYPAWTDHNPADPGIALIELLAWLSEMLIYRAGRLPEGSVWTFLRLLNGASAAQGASLDLDDAVRTTLLAIRERWRAVTSDDYEALALAQWPGSPEANAAQLRDEERNLVRACCLAERDLSGATPTAPAPGHMSLIVLPGLRSGASPWDAPRPELLAALKGFFRDRQVVSTRLHVAGPTYVAVSISATLYLRDDALPDQVRSVAPKALAAYFDPRSGGQDGKGWSFGREVLASEVYARLDASSGVEFVKDVTLTAPGQPDTRNLEDGGRVIGLRMAPHELPRVEPGNIRFALMERRSDKWEPVP